MKIDYLGLLQYAIVFGLGYGLAAFMHWIIDAVKMKLWERKFKHYELEHQKRYPDTSKLTINEMLQIVGCGEYVGGNMLLLTDKEFESLMHNERFIEVIDNRQLSLVKLPETDLMGYDYMGMYACANDRNLLFFRENKTKYDGDLPDEMKEIVNKVCNNKNENSEVN